MMGITSVQQAAPDPPCHVAARVTDEALLSEVADKLKSIERTTALARTLAIGEVILNRFFGGDPNVWRERRRNKNNSIRRLAERPDCPYGKSALNEAVGVFVSVRHLPCVFSLEHISASHVGAVLRLPHTERERMLRRADEERWSVRQLRLEVVRLNRSVGERRGRPCADARQKLVRDLSVQVAQLERTLGTLIENMASERSTVREAARFQELAARLARQATRLQAAAVSACIVQCSVGEANFAQRAASSSAG